MSQNKNKSTQKPGPLGVAVKGIIQRNGKYLIIKRSAESSLDPDLWDLPGGKLDYGEEAAETLIRETKEETGLTIKVKQPFTTWHFFKNEVYVTGITFLCEYVKGNVVLSHEHSDYAWIKPNEHHRYPLTTALKPQLKKYYNHYLSKRKPRV